MGLTFGSLFSGVGGFDLGFERAGWECKWQVEWDMRCQNVLNKHWSSVPKWLDVCDVDGGVVAPVDCIIFGSPCQDLSLAGRRAGIDGSKSSMFFEAVRIIGEMRDATSNVYPRVTVWENVPGALTSNGGDDFGKVLETLGDIGAVEQEWAVLDAQYFGVPQRRRRIFLVSVFDTDIGRRCPEQILPVHQGVKRNDKQAEGIVGFYSTQGKYDVPEVNKLPPLKTVAAPCISGETLRPRRLTPVEAERLMGWSDDHTRWGADGTEQADTHRYKQCGNGVASPVAQWVAEQISNLVGA